MGSIASRDCLGPAFATEEPSTSPLPQSDKEIAIKASILEAIKRRDCILFEKAIQQYEIRPLEIVGPAGQQKTLLHYAAEHNFHEGMTLALDYVTYFQTHETSLKSNVSTPKRRRRLALKSLASAIKDQANLASIKEFLLILTELGEDCFNDEEFPHDINSISHRSSHEEIIKKFGVPKWRRPIKFMSNNLEIKIFEDIELGDVTKSFIGWCDLYSALAAMAEYPQRLLKIFGTKEVTKQGVYSLNFLVAGINLEIILDDYFPCSEMSRPVFSKPKSNELWFLLLEKAFAKLYGSYLEIKNVMTAEAFEIMTGMPSSQHPLREAREEDLWNTLLEYDQRNYIVCAGSYDKFPNNNRVFMVSGVYEVEQERIVKLKNHYNAIKWKGEFENGSKKWTRGLKEEVGHYEGEKNNFYMSIQEFIKTFSFFSVCHYHDNWIRNGIYAEAEPGEGIFFEFEIEREMEVFISVHQKLPIFMEKHSEYEISPVEIIMAEKTPDGLKGIAYGEKDALLGKPTVYATDKVKLKLSEGSYVIRVKIRWVDHEAHEFKISTFSPHPIEIKRAEDEDDYENFLEDIYMDAGKNHPGNFELGHKCKFGSGWAGPYFWIYAANDGKTLWNIEILFEKKENLKVCNLYRKADDTLELVVPPGKRVVSYVRRLNGNPVEMKWKLEQTWEEISAE